MSFTLECSLLWTKRCCHDPSRIYGEIKRRRYNARGLSLEELLHRMDIRYRSDTLRNVYAA